MAIQVILKNDHGGNFIDMLTPAAPVQAHFFKMLFCFKTGEAFIPENDGNVDDFA